ncbi:MAG: phage tail protein [Phototrophicales bacterium]|nr:MAG: phage tail protein [Phototrophicales bacterium]
MGGFIDFDPVSSHRFVLTIDNDIVGAFSECTLPNLEFEVEERKEGGQNDYTHVLVSRRKSGRLILKRGVAKDSILLKWYHDLLQGKMTDAVKNVSVVIYSPDGKVTGWWFFADAFPVKWSGPQIKSDQAAIAIETLELVVHEYIVG